MLCPRVSMHAIMDSCPRMGITARIRRLLGPSAPAYITSMNSAPASPPCSSTFASVSQKPLNPFVSPVHTLTLTAQAISALMI